MDARNLSDRELLVLTFQDVQELKRSVNGNGRPGLNDRVTELETLLEERTNNRDWTARGGLVATILGLFLERVLK